jgi:acyl dehydratase
MAQATKNLLTSDIKVGEALPALSVDVTPTLIVLGAMATRDWRPMHHDHDFAVNRNGTQDIFMNTPNQAAWFERYVTDWTGATGRLGRMKFRMSSSVYPGDAMVFGASVENVSTDDQGCSWVDLNVTLKVSDKTVTTCAVRVAVPADANDNPWKRKGDDWKP